MERVSREDTLALGLLVERYQNDIFRFCAHYVRDVECAKDIAQETFIRVYVARNRFDVTRRFRPWILCIARNLCLNELKRKKAVPLDTIEDYASTARDESGEVWRTASDGPDGAMMTAERREALGTMLETLDEESRELMKLRFFEQLPARDIAEIMRSTEGAVRTRLHRILKGLRADYERLREDL